MHCPHCGGDLPPATLASGLGELAKSKGRSAEQRKTSAVNGQAGGRPTKEEQALRQEWRYLVDNQHFEGTFLDYVRQAKS